MTAALSLLAIVIVAYVAAHFLFDWIAQRYRVLSGAEYLVLGILLGPRVTGVMSATVVQSFAPFMILALGWTGAALGMNCHLPRLLRIPAGTYTTAIVEATITFVFVAAVMLFGVAWAFGLAVNQVVLPALSMAAIATASTSQPLLALSAAPQTRVLTQLATSVLIDNIMAITCFGILLCIVHVDTHLNQHLITATEWAAIGIAIGVVCGILFHLFIGSERHPDLLFVALAGAIILASGAAAYLRLSPLLPSFLIGAILVNTSDNREVLTRLMQTVEKPLYYVLLLFAGAAWVPSARYNWLLLVMLFVFVRAAAKLGAARLASRATSDQELVAANWGRGLLGQGTIALAIGMSYSINDTALVPNVVFSASVASLLLTDLFGLRRLAVLLRDAAPDITPRVVRRFTRTSG
ncbi:MAG TPA: hypothetical protein VF021_00185 [Longimicrobiales bacterium]